MGNEIVGVGNILVKPTPELLKLQQELAVAIKPFEAPTKTIYRSPIRGRWAAI
jgi:hypothetical protein